MSKLFKFVFYLFIMVAFYGMFKDNVVQLNSDVRGYFATQSEEVIMIEMEAPTEEVVEE